MATMKNDFKGDGEKAFYASATVGDKKPVGKKSKKNRHLDAIKVAISRKS